MSHYRYLFWDIDGTILDFAAAEAAAVRTLMQKYGYGECREEMLQRYVRINTSYWQKLERGEMSKPEILVRRWMDFFDGEGITGYDAAAFNHDYQLALGDTLVFHDNAPEILKELKKDYILAATTNGTRAAQSKKLTKSGLIDLFDAVFISDDVGYEKPSKEYFAYVLKAMKITDCSQILIIGDSLTSDIQGGVNMGIDTCWYNPAHLPADPQIPAVYTIADLQELNGILQNEQ